MTNSYNEIITVITEILLLYNEILLKIQIQNTKISKYM